MLLAHKVELRPTPEQREYLELSDAAELGAFAAGGGIAGVAASTLVGNMGLAVAGTAVSIGLLPVVAIGAMAGLAAYGVKRAFFDDDNSTPQPSANSSNTEEINSSSPAESKTSSSSKT